MGSKSLKRNREVSNGDSTQASLTPSKRQRQSKTDNVKLAKLYEDLAAESEDVRLEAAKEILQKFSADGDANAEAVEKFLNRLIKGLCSQRKAARFGFFITLTEFLRQSVGHDHPALNALDLGVSGIIDLVEKITQPAGNVSGQERRDHLIGRLFGYKAIMQSSIVVKPELLVECWNDVLDRICTMARDIPWLREECGLILYDLVKNLGPESPPECLGGLIERLVSSKLVNTPEGVAVWLAIRTHFLDKPLPLGIWHDKDPLSKKERTRLARILKEDFRNAPEEGNAETIKSAAANPNPIFAWDVVLSEILKRDGETGDEKSLLKKSEFAQFWIDTVDSNLFASSSSHERKSWGFKLLAKLVTSAPRWTIPALFSPNLTRSLINQSKDGDRFLHAAALASLKAIKARAQNEPASAASLFIALTSKHGVIDFDKLTKTKTLEQIVQSADDDALEKIVDHLHTLILRPGTEEQAVADLRRRLVADMLLHIVKTYSKYDASSDLVKEDDTWLQKLLSTFVENAYFVPTKSAKTKKIPLPPINDASRKMFQERLSSCLGRLLVVGTDVGVSFPFLIVSMIRSRAKDGKHTELVFKADESIMKTVEKAHKSLERLSEKIPSKKNATAEGFVLLYSLSLLQVYDGDADAVLMLEELEAFRKSSKKGSTGEGSDNFVEIILTFLGNPRTLFLKVAEQAFSVFVPNITSDGLQSLLDILATEENIAGQQALFAQGDEEAIEADGSDDDEDASDVEMIDGESGDSEEEGSEDNGSDDASSEEDSGDESGEEDPEELARFDALLAQTLQTSKPAAGMIPDNSSDDEDMDDEQMMALDPHLVKIFQERAKVTSKKKEREGAKQTVVQFKSRVLDLLAIFVEKQQSSPLALEIVVPLIQRVRPSTNKQIADKSYKILKSYFGGKKAALPVPEEENTVWQMLQDIHEEAKLGGGSTLHANACSSASVYTAKVLVSLNKKNYVKVVDVYAESQKEWFMDKKSAVQPSLFTEFQNWSTQTRKQGK
ncbi:hypothetical protein GQ43DRAFT_453433 [Delitschia confertaspora ATCC 74209]|uniref:DNA polymerase V n=1 Tax=Delitschia confertaspora ATCC 74209 TaxID=1513339 RepID=A0A9P4N2M2_9PLEO|nr:hypothetical protein GQ43DRAFT_453433 [Delitschia confertaspora ATCC 74209]